MKRVHAEEILDAGSGSDADVAASLADLRRINRFLGGRRVLRILLREQVRRIRLDSFTLLDVGSGSGDLPAEVVRWYPKSRIAALDLYHRHLRMGGLEAEPRIWPVCGDVWRLPFAARSFDFVSASLFAHHFGESDLPRLLAVLAAMARHAVLINDLDRHW